MTYVYAACRVQTATGALQLVVEDRKDWEQPGLYTCALPLNMYGSGLSRSFVKLPRVPGSLGRSLGGWR